MQKETINVLTSKVPEHTRPGGGGQYKYVKGEDVIARLNTAFAHEWSSRIEKVFDESNHIVALVSLEAGGITHQGFGGADVKQGVPLSNVYKAAFTSGLKKAAEQFGVGLGVEDTVSLAEVPVVASVPSPNPPGLPPTGMPAEAMKPVSGSVVVPAAAPVETPPVDMAKVQEELAKLMAVKAPVEEPAPKAKASLASNFDNKKYNPADTRHPEAASPFAPSGDGAEKINDIQLNALGGLAKLKKVTPEEAIRTALDGTAKLEFAQLTRDEAKSVIHTLNNTNG